MNVELFVIFMLILMFLNGILYIIAGCLGLEKSTKYGAADVVGGVLTLVFVVLILIL